MRVVVAALVVVALTVGLSAAAAAPQPRVVFAADKAATRDGEIYSFDLATGKTHDISRSRADDMGAAISPDGRSIAFGSTRSGVLALYVARIDGSGLRVVKTFRPGFTALVARWSPDGSRIAATAGTCCAATDEVWLGTPDGVGVIRLHAAAYAPAAWSPDGRVFAYGAHDLASAELTSIDVVDTAGRLLWRRDADGLRYLGWSAGGRLAWTTGNQVHLATETGAALPGLVAQNVAWSPDGRTLALLRMHTVELRADGTGAPRVVYRSSPRAFAQGINWLGPRYVVVSVFGDDAYRRVDVHTGKPAKVGYEDVGGLVSGGDRLIASSSWGRRRSLSVGPLVGPSRVIASTSDCPDDHSDPYQPVGFVPGKRLVVYEATCGDPTADVYSVRSDGSGLRQLTYTAAHEQTPVLSPDGSRIAYIRSASIGHGCEGCPSELWVMDADGTHARRLTAPGIKDGIGDWDSHPSWSPDGKSIVFDRSAASSWLGLFVIAADGGTPQSLHIPGAERPVWGPHRIAYRGQRGAIWTANADGSDRRLVAARHTCDNGCFYGWTPKGLAYATLQRHVTHTTLWTRGAGGTRRVQLPPVSFDVAWADGGRTLLLAPPRSQTVTGAWAEGDVYRVEADGTLTRLTVGLGSISLG
jgi:Tol biopolymer transport system component